uniref:Uncharacterized protein n=1 Tax=Setaria italica TaxID=4555 RepID=K3YKI0_SETIT
MGARFMHWAGARYFWGNQCFPRSHPLSTLHHPAAVSIDVFLARMFCCLLKIILLSLTCWLRRCEETEASESFRVDNTSNGLQSSLIA